MSNSLMITPAYLSKICQVMRKHGVKELTLPGVSIGMFDKGGAPEPTKVPRTLEDLPQAPATIDELDDMIRLSTFEVTDDE